MPAIPDLLNEMEPSETDLAYRMVNGLFDAHTVAGEAATEGISSGMATLVAEQAMIFNSVVITAMAFMISLTMMSALVQSNYDGVPFGKSIHTIWGPVRIAIAIVALAPMPGMNGFSVIQNIVIKSSYASIGLASYMARSGIDNLGKAIEEGKEIDGRSGFLTPQFEELVGTILDLSVLGYYAESRRLKEGAIASGAAGADGIRQWRNNLASKLNSGSAFPSFVAGRKAAKVSENGTFRQLGSQGYVFEFSAYSRGYGAAKWRRNNNDKLKTGSISIECSTASFSKEACLKRIALVKRLINTISQAAATVVYNEVDYRTAREQKEDLKAGQSLDFRRYNFEGAYSDVLSIQQGYRVAGIQSGVMKERAQVIHQTISNRIERDGFLMLGATHIALSHLLEEVSAMAGSMPMGSTSNDYSSLLDYYARKSVTYDNAFQFTGVVKSAHKSMRIFIDTSDEEAGLDGDGSANAFKKMIYKYFGAPFNVVPNPMETELGADPLLHLQSVGHTGIAVLEGVAVGVVLGKSLKDGALAAAEAAKDAANSNPITGLVASPLTVAGFGVAATVASVAESAFGVIEYFVMFTIIPFLAMAYYLPFVPLLLWAIAIAGMFIHIIEAVVAAPIWAAAHASTEGDGLMGVHSRAGYMLILGILLRPPLMVFSFFVSFEMMDLMMHIFNMLFGLENRSLAAGTIMGLVSWIAMLYLYTLTIIALEHKIFGLVTWLPDNAINWAGQTMGRSLGSETQSEAARVGGGLGALPGGAPGAFGAGLKDAAAGKPPPTKTTTNEHNNAGDTTAKSTKK